MSTVTNIILSFSIIEDDRDVDGENVYFFMDSINKWLSDNNFGSFGKEADSPNTQKCLETPIFTAAFNYFDLGGFVAFINLLDWEERENVQIFVQEQEDDKFTIMEINH